MTDKPIHWRLYAGLVLCVLLAVFIFQNMTVVTVRLLFWKIELSRALMLLVVFLTGIATGAALMGVRRKTRR